MQKLSKDIIKVTIFIFLINFIWEISQMFLYVNHTTDFWNFIFVHIKASIGDVLIFFIIYILGALILQSKKWIFLNNNYKYLLASFLGFIIAVAIEKYALTTNRWAYNSLMPIIPFLNVGLSPILQMMILPTLAISILEKNQNKNSN